MLFLAASVSASLASDCQIVSQVFKEMGSFTEIDPVNCCQNFIVDCAGDSVTGVTLSSFGETQISPKLFELASLTSLSLSMLDSKGPLPTGFGKLVNLKNLKIESQFSGSLPDDFAALNLTSLTLNSLSVDTTPRLSGSLAVIANMRSLKNLDLSRTGFAIVDELAGHPSLESVTASNSWFEGTTVLDVFASMPNLKSLSLKNSRLSGTVPESLRRIKLRELDLSSNFELQGRFPFTSTDPIFQTLSTCSVDNTAVCVDPGVVTKCSVTVQCPSPKRQFQCEKVRRLRQSVNAPYPSKAFKNSNNCCVFDYLGAKCNDQDDIVELRFEGQEWSGPFPERLSTDFPKLKSLTLLFNRIQGAIPESIAQLKELETLIFREQTASGPLPKSLGSMTTLKSLNIQLFGLKGAFPDQILSLTNLKELRLKASLTGPFPSLGNLNKLEQLDLSGNSFDGSLPEDIGSLTLLTELLFSRNKLSGTLPASFANLTSLVRLEMDENDISGTFPAGSSYPKLTSCTQPRFMCQTAELPGPPRCRLPQCATK